jgi:hypothetical protein
MTFEAQRNEVAGSTEQKLPPGDVGAVTAVNAISGQGGAKPSLDFSWRETPPEVVAIVNLSGKPAELADPEPTTAPSAVTQAGRLEQLVSREVVTIHQTGAQTLGVSLKLDENTHIFLQLTTENGQIQASLRCEKGDFSALDSQWTQLQASLARQNVQLVPASGASQSNFQQTSQHQKRELPQGREEWRHPGRVATPAQSRQQKNPNARRSRPDWEFWA